MEKQESQGSVASAGQENWNQMEISLSQEAERTAGEEREPAREEPVADDDPRRLFARESAKAVETASWEPAEPDVEETASWEPAEPAVEETAEPPVREADGFEAGEGEASPEQERPQPDGRAEEAPGGRGNWYAGERNRESPETEEEPVIGPEEAFLRELAAQVENEKTRDYIETRIIPQMEWCREKGAEYGARYQDCMRASIILGALIPVFAVFANGARMVKVLIALFGAGITALNAYLTLYNFRDLELDFRGTGEALLRTLYCYFNDAGAFAQAGSQTEKDALLVDICEDVLSP